MKTKSIFPSVGFCFMVLSIAFGIVFFAWGFQKPALEMIWQMENLLMIHANNVARIPAIFAAERDPTTQELPSKAVFDAAFNKFKKRRPASDWKVRGVTATPIQQTSEAAKPMTDFYASLKQDRVTGIGVPSASLGIADTAGVHHARVAWNNFIVREKTIQKLTPKKRK